MDARESEQLWGELKDQRETLQRIEALTKSAADGVFALNSALNLEIEARKRQDAQIATKAAAAIVATVRDQLDRRSITVSAGATLAVQFVFAAIVAILRAR
jgi:hypothetical protein